MGLTRTQAWLTYVTRNDHVTHALVLAEALQRTKTAKRLAAISSSKISPENLDALHKSFDDVFFLKDEALNSTSGKSEEDYYKLLEIQAKTFAFSLDIFEKCVFLEPNSIVLENTDCVFEKDGNIVPLLDSSDATVLKDNSDFYVLTPNRKVSRGLRKQALQLNGSARHKYKTFTKQVQEFFGNNHEDFEADGETSESENSVIQFSLKSGVLTSSNFWESPKIIQFTDSPYNQDELISRLHNFSTSGMCGLAQKVIAQTWLSLHQSIAVGMPKEPMIHPPNEPIAIIGLGCRLPGANSLEEFWSLLHAGEEAIREPPAFRWRNEHIVGNITEEQRKAQAGFLECPVDEFDSRFFGLSPKEAIYTDPQVRLMLEVVWESLEDGGIDPTSLRGTHTGIFTGSWMHNYCDIVQHSAILRDFFRTYMGNSIGAGASKLSFLLGLTGPCIATESGCSSAIVAVDMAVKSLRCGEINLGLAGGVNLLLHAFTGKELEYVIAKDGRCKTFDANADGFGRAEACGVLVLKRLSDALRDQDNIWAVIRGSALSQEGISRSLGTPTVHCETLAMKKAMKNAGVTPEQVSFVEAHGTGTNVGDPLEIQAICKAYKTEKRKEPLVIGSVKTNVGHTESCSGITGIIKTILSLQKEVIPKHLNMTTLNPEIDLETIPAVIPVKPMTWPKVPGQMRVAGISSFGITGTDGHVIIEEAPENTFPRFELNLERPLHILKFSAKSKPALDEMLEKYGNLLTSQNLNESFANIAYTANAGRASFEHRAFITAGSIKEAAEAIQARKLVRNEISDDSVIKICLLFTGQGSQYPGMAKLLYETSPVFRVNFDHCQQILQTDYNISLRQILWSDRADKEQLSKTLYSQPSIFCVEYCLFKLWESWGIKPDFVLGHSLGEFCAAVACGFLEFSDALKLLTERSKLIERLKPGNMLVVNANQTKTEEIIKFAAVSLDFAAFNTPTQTVVAGNAEAIQKLKMVCEVQNVKARLLEASHAFHSSDMDPMLPEYRKIAENIQYGTTDGNCQFISGMEGESKTELDANYWVEHTRKPVNFLKASETLKQFDCKLFLEIGPHPVLSAFVLENCAEKQPICCPSIKRNKNDWEIILQSLGNLYINGVDINWNRFDRPYNRKRVVNLPFYPFQRKSYWVNCDEQYVPVDVHPLVGHSVENASSVISIFEHDLILRDVAYLRDHCIGNKVIFPGAAFTEMCLAAGYCVTNYVKDQLESPRQAICLENVKIEAPLQLMENAITKLQVVVDLQENEGFRCRVFHKSKLDSQVAWVKHCSAKFNPVVTKIRDLLAEWDGKRVEEIVNSGDGIQLEFYKKIETVGLKFGETFRSIQKQWWREEDKNEIVAEIKVPQDFQKYLIHPAVLDAMFQAQILAGVRTNQKTEVLRVPVHIEKLVLLQGLDHGRIAYVHAKLLDQGNSCKVCLFNKDFVPIALTENVTLLETNAKTIHSMLEQQISHLPDNWEETWKPVSGPMERQVEIGNLQDVLDHPDFETRLQGASKIVPEDTENLQNLDRLVTLYALRALYQLGWKPDIGEKWNVDEFCKVFQIKEKFRQLLYFYMTMLEEELRMISILDDTQQSWIVSAVLYTSEEQVDNEIAPLFEKMTKNNRLVEVCQIYQNVAKYLAKILTGEENALPILFPVDANEKHLSAEVYYHKHPSREDASSKTIELTGIIGGAVRNINVQDGRNRELLRVLEVGAGTGMSSLGALQQFNTYWGEKLEYYYTDISASFFTKADKRLDEYKKQLKFATFNIEEHPLGQGIPVNYFDCVHCADVLHATRDLKESLQNIRLVMKPGSLLIFTDTVVQEKGHTFVFGLLEGYWRFTDFEIRKHHACVGSQSWINLLRETGFRVAHACEASLGRVGILMAQASETRGYDIALDRKLLQGESGRKKWVVFSPEGSTAILEKVEHVLGQLWGVVRIRAENEREYTEEQIVELLKEHGDSIQGIIYGWAMETGRKLEQHQVSRPFLGVAQWMLTVEKPPRLYVITRDVNAVNEERINPWPATLQGMAKSLKNENSDIILRCVDLDGDREEAEGVTGVLFELAMYKETHEKERIQTAYRKGARYEPRFSKAGMHHGSKVDLKLPQGTDRYKLKLPETRIINDLEFIPAEPEVVGESEVEVRTTAYGLNFRDILSVLKPIEMENLNAVGLDFAGVVTKADAAGKWKVGDRVFGANLKEVQLPSYLVCQADNLMRIPDWITDCEAATLPAVFSTAYHCLVTVGNMKKGETVLIHTGSGGVGLSAIQLAKHVGAVIITTAGSPRKRAYLKSLGIEHVFHSRNTSYKEEILKVTNGKGVDIVLNSLTGPGFKEATLAVCAKHARFLEMSKLAVWTEEEVKNLRADVQYSIVDLTKLDIEVFRDVQEKTEEFMKSKKLITIPYVKFDAMRIRQAFQFFQKAKHIGKVIVSMPWVGQEDGEWKTKVNLFNEQSAYLITGGLGGIGFEVCKWMLARGAKYLVLLGRSEPSQEIQKDIEKLNQIEGNRVVVKICDVGNYQELKQVVEEVSKEMPIRGVQHCAGVLRDNMYNNQNWKSFEDTFQGKVEGTWNLHRLLDNQQLEHFVMYSSLTALVGTPGQANHAAANCFEDAFANYRHYYGLPATSINWGQWSQVGCAKEVNLAAILPVSVKRMLNGLEETLRCNKVRVSFGDFESLSMWTMVCPMFKYYLDEKILKMLNEQDGMNDGDGLLFDTQKFWQEVDAAITFQDKLDVVSTYIKRILRTALRMEPDEPIKDDANMQDLGVDSLMAIELRNSIQGLLGDRLTIQANQIKDCQNIRQLSTVIVNKITNVDDKWQPLSAEELEQLLREDCKLEESIRPPTLLANGAKLRVEDVRICLVTGAVGQLGPYVVQRLCEMERVEEVICIVRTKGTETPQERLEQTLKNMELWADTKGTNKLKAVKGNVAEENLGIDEEEYIKLCERVDAVFNLAVKNNHLEPYRKIEDNSPGLMPDNVRAVNVLGTVNVLKFCVEKRTKFLYHAGSIASILGGSEEDETLADKWPEFDEVTVITENSVSGYPASKYVGEMLVKQACERGLPCKIFRFPWICGESETGRVNYERNHLVLRFLSYLKLKAMPESNWPAFVLPVDICAEMSLEVFWNGEAPLEIYNIMHPEPELEAEFARVAKEDFGTEVKLEEWRGTDLLQKLCATDMPLESLRDLYEDLERIVDLTSTRGFKAIKGYYRNPGGFFRNPKLEKWLPGFGRGLPSTTETLRKDMLYVKSRGYFEKFGL